MSYIVKGAEMPRNCEDCLFLSFSGAGDYPYCVVTGTKKDCTFIPKLMTERMDSCPLAELPPHGRLIDATKLCELCDIMAEKCGEPSLWKQFKNVIEDLPTIIEEEKE